MRDPLGCYDKSGQPISFERYEELKYNTDGTISDYARIGLDTIDDVVVSTVWLGLDHSFLKQGPRIIFETLISGGDYSGDINRYSGEGSALIGHRCAVNNIRRGRAPW